MNDKTKDLLKRLRSISSAKALAIELEKSIKEYEDSRLIIDKEWLKRQIVCHSVVRFNTLNTEVTYMLNLACLIEAEDGYDERVTYEIACKKIFNLMKEGK